MKGNQTESCISQLLQTKPNNTWHFLNILSWKIIQLDFRFLKLNIQNNYPWDELSMNISTQNLVILKSYWSLE